MSHFKVVDEEFQPIAKMLFEKHREKLNLTVDPSKVMFLRSDKKKKAYAYCKLIHGEYELLTTKRFFIVIVNENYDSLASNDEKKYVILHEMMHVDLNLDNDKYRLLKHNLEEFGQLLINPKWNLDLVR